MAERSARERETLIFATPEAAAEFKEATGEQLRAQEKTAGVGQKREVIADAVAAEFAKEGETVALVKTPWEHTSVEHEEVQHLVDVAFAKDLPTAIKQARGSPHYPRNLDLLHDVLTGEMYDAMKGSGIAKQSILPWVLAFVLAVVVIAVLTLFGWIY